MSTIRVFLQSKSRPALWLAALVASALLSAALGCGTTRAKPVPRVAGERLDLAQDRLDELGLEYDTVGGGAAGVVFRSHWRVCSQRPRPGTKARSVELFVARSCGVATGTVPNVVGESLEDAKEELDDAGLDYEVDDGEHEPLIDHLWTVCGQTPEPGATARAVELYVERLCDDFDEDDD
jgi:eukaryotic-like serine/threonine-protein kinase